MEPQCLNLHLIFESAGLFSLSELASRGNVTAMSLLHPC